MDAGEVCQRAKRIENEATYLKEHFWGSTYSPEMDKLLRRTLENIEIELKALKKGLD